MATREREDGSGYVGLSIDAGAITKAVSDAVLQSAIGEQVNDIIKDALKKRSATFGGGVDPITQAVTLEVQRIVGELIRSEYSEKVREMVRTKLTDEYLNELADNAMRFAKSGF